MLQREREHFDLRLKHEQLAVWLSLGQALPALFLDRTSSQQQIWDRVRKTFISKLRLQRVLLLELCVEELRPLSPGGAARALPPEARELLEARPWGLCNDAGADPVPAVRALAQTVGLHRFMWSRISREGDHPILLVAGFDQSKAAFQSPFVDNDPAHLANSAQHLESLIGNYLLVLELERAAQQLRASNESLEQRVRERTQELASRNRELRLVLDNVDQALITIDLDGRLAPEHSSVFDRWFGSYSGTPSFVEHVAADRRFAEFFALGLDALRDDILPREVCLAQMPQAFVVGARHFECRCLPIDDRGRCVALLLVIDDVTERHLRAREDAEHRELLAAFMALTRDRGAFLAFIDETDRMLEKLCLAPSDRSQQKRLLHTLKGNAASVGLQVTAELCHSAESELVNLDVVQDQTLERLRTHFRAVVDTLRSLAPDELRRCLEISVEDVERLERQVRDGAPASQIVEQLRLLTWEPVARQLGRLAQHARALAGRLGKGPLKIEIDADDLRLDPARWSPLWSALVHVVSNAVDHGLESPAERYAAGKMGAGHLRLAAHRSGQGYRLEISDDGRGIDWAQVRRVCEEQKRPFQSRADLVAAILAPGFSTRSKVSQTSGRGIGLAAVAHIVSEFSGELAFDSEPGRGTRIELTFSGSGPGAPSRQNVSAPNRASS